MRLTQIKQVLLCIVTLSTSSLIAQCDFDPTIDLSPMNPDGIYCPGDILTLSTEESDAYQWFYNFSNSNIGGTAFSGGSTQSIEVNASEWAVVYFYVESTIEGCTEASPTVVWDGWVFNSPAISGPGQSEFCEGEFVTISNAFPGPVFFQWYQNGSPIPGAINADYIVTESGTYVLEAAYAVCPNNFLSSGVGPSFTFIEAIVPVITLSDNTLESSSAATYSWSLNGNTIPGATAETYSPTESGLYAVTTTDANGCEATSVDFNYIISGLDDISQLNLAISYGSSNGEITVKSEGAPIGKVSIYNGLGQLLSTQSSSDSQLSLDVSAYSHVMILVVAEDHDKTAVFQLD